MKRRPKIQQISPEDSAFLEEIYIQHGSFMMEAAMVYTKKDEMYADDVMQDAVIRLINHVQTLRALSEPELRAYLRKTVKTTFTDAYRKEKRYRKLTEKFFQQMAAREQELEPDLYLDWKLQTLKEDLSPREWMILEQKFILGYSNKEIGAVLGMRPGSVRMTLSRIYKKSRGILPEGVR